MMNGTLDGIDKLKTALLGASAVFVRATKMNFGSIIHGHYFYLIIYLYFYSCNQFGVARAEFRFVGFFYFIWSIGEAFVLASGLDFRSLLFYYFEKE